MAKKVEVEIEIKDKDTDKTKDKIGSLKQQIRETTQAMQKLELQGKATGAEYEKLRQKLDNLNDTQDKAKFKAGQFEDRLAALPGPLGKIGSGLKAAGDSFATFGTTLTVSLGVIGLLVTAFFAIKSALEKTKEGQQGLSKAMEAFNKVLSPIFAILEKVGLIVLPLVTKGFEALGSVMNKVAKFFGVTDNKIKEVQDTLQKDNEYKKKLDEEEKARLDDLQKKKDEKAQKDKERREQAIKDREEAERLAFEQEKRDLEFQLTELERIRAKFKKINLDPIGSDGLTKAEREKEETDKTERQKYFADKNAKLLEESNKTGLGKVLADKAVLLEKDFAKEQETSDAKINLAKLELQSKQETAYAIADITAGLAGLIDQDTAAGKAAALASATIDTYLSASTIFKQASKNPITVVNPAYPYLMAAPAVLAGLARVKQIMSVKTKVGVAGVGGGMATSGPVPTYAGNPNATPVPQIGSGVGGMNPTQQIGETLSQTQKPIRAYVVSNEVSSQQALDRRTNVAATFG